MKKAILYLEDGTIFIGQSLTVTGETAGGEMRCPSEEIR